MAALVIRSTSRLSPLFKNFVGGVFCHGSTNGMVTPVTQHVNRKFTNSSLLNAERKFTEEHEWLLLKDDASDVATVGVSDFAQSQLGDMVYVELPEVGRAITKGEEMMVLESVKAASDVYAPVDGEVVEVNNALEERPELVNSSPYDEGWLFTMKVADVSSLDSLMNEKEYEKFIEGQE